MTTRILPRWADELRHRYLRGEASLFVMHGNVHDQVLYRDNLLGVPDFLANSVLEKKAVVVRYNVATGCHVTKREGEVPFLDELLIQRAPAKVLPLLEQLLYSQKNVALIVEFADMVAPAAETAFSSEQDRLAVVTLQRWSLAPQLDLYDNLVILLTEVPSELHPKIVANPRVAAVKVPMPDREQRRAVIDRVNPELEPAWSNRLADITAGLKSVQIKSILQPSHPAEEDQASRLRYIKSLVADDQRARKLAGLTQGMSRDEVCEIIGVEQKPDEKSAADEELEEVLRLIARRKREILERECFGLIEFVEPSHDFSVVGGLEEIKKELKSIAKNIREARHNRVPMGLLFAGPMGTGKTFVAEAFVRESGLTGIKLKNFRSKWVGATESNLERILEVVQALGNVIVIIDEGDRSFGSDGEGDSGTSSRVIARLKEFMSDTTNRGRVLFIVMTNRPDRLDIDIKRAGRLDRKIPFFYGQGPEEVEAVLLAQVRKHGLLSELAFPRDRALTQNLVGYSNADLEALMLLAHNDVEEGLAIDATIFARAKQDYLPSRDVKMLEFMELLAVFEASNRRMLPAKYADLSAEDLQNKLAELRLTCGGRR